MLLYLGQAKKTEAEKILKIANEKFPDYGQILAQLGIELSKIEVNLKGASLVRERISPSSCLSQCHSVLSQLF